MKKIKLNEGHIARNASMNVETKFAKRWMEKGNAKPIREDGLSDYGVDPDELAAYGVDIEANTRAYEKLQRNAELFAKYSGRDIGKLILSWSYECPEEFKDVWVDGNTLPIRNKLGTVIAKKVFLATDGLNEFSDTDIITDVVFSGIMEEDDDEVVYCMESVSSIGDAMKNCIEYVIEHMKDEYVPVDDESRSLGIYEKKEGATAKRFFDKHTDVKRVNESKETVLNEAYDQAANKKKVLSFIKKVVREIPDFKAEWENLMSSDPDELSHDRENDLEIIHDVFKEYGTHKEKAITFDAEKNCWRFIIPINMNHIDYGYDQKEEAASMVKEMAQQEWPEARSIEVTTGKFQFSDISVVKLTIYEGNKSSTFKKLAQNAIKKFLSKYTIIQSFEITDRKIDNSGNATDVPSTLYIYETTSKWDEMRTFGTLSIRVEEENNYDGPEGSKKVHVKVQLNGRIFSTTYSKDSSDFNSDAIVKDIEDYFFKSNDEEY